MGQFFNTAPNPPLQTIINGLASASDARGLMWEHLIYAYMIENTRVYEVFRRVIHELVHGEKLGPARQATQSWLRNTEMLFFDNGNEYSGGVPNYEERPERGRPPSAILMS